MSNDSPAQKCFKVRREMWNAAETSSAGRAIQYGLKKYTYELVK